MMLLNDAKFAKTKQRMRPVAIVRSRRNYQRIRVELNVQPVQPIATYRQAVISQKVKMAPVIVIIPAFLPIRYRRDFRHVGSAFRAVAIPDHQPPGLPGKRRNPKPGSEQVAAVPGIRVIG